MEKEVLVSIKGLQFVEGEGPNEVETINKGQYYIKDGKHYILFEEVMEEYKVPIKNMIKLSDTTCSVNKKGPINVNMLFDREHKNMTNYVTPFGTILIGIDTHKMDLVISEDQIKVYIEYALEANYEHLSNCKLTIVIKSCSKGISLT